MSSLEEDKTEPLDPPEEDPKWVPHTPCPQQRRTKERKIEDVLQKVALWRQLYEGFQDNQGHFHKLSLEESASKLEISKKTLDDYLL